MVPWYSGSAASILQASTAMSWVAAANATRTASRAMVGARQGGGTGSNRVIHAQRCMVGKPGSAEHRRRGNPIFQSRRYQLVIDAPTDVVCVGVAAVAPPGVSLALECGMQRAIAVDPAGV